MAGGASGSKKQRKVGRNKDYSQFYKATHRREKNKKVRLARHLKYFPDDKVAAQVLKVLSAAY